MPAKLAIPTGMTFGRWTVLREDFSKTFRHFICRCECGNKRSVSLANLRFGTSTQCKPCSVSEIKQTHGQSHGSNKTPEYNSWTHILSRCRNARNKSYENYGARGIKVCPRWEQFENFIADMGPRPSPMHSLDRIDNHGDYEPNNCRWATTGTQANNKRSNRLLTFNGETKTIAEWSAQTGIKYRTILGRLERLDWTIEKILTTPGSNYRSRH